MIAFHDKDDKAVKSILYGVLTNHILRKYADDLVLLAREEKALQGMVDRLSEIGRRYGMEMNVEKTKVMRTQGNQPQ
jgi:hypothetical protein